MPIIQKKKPRNRGPIQRFRSNRYDSKGIMNMNPASEYLALQVVGLVGHLSGHNSAGLCPFELRICMRLATH